VAAALVEELRAWVADQLSPIAKPDDIRFADNLPKTRSGKIMRRLLRSIARDEEITQDVSTLENPAILEQLRGAPQAAKRRASPRKAPRKRAAAKTPPRATLQPPARNQKAAVKKKARLKKKAAVKKKAAPIKKGVKRGKAARKPRGKK
jgi:hypothetical protein